MQKQGVAHKKRPEESPSERFCVKEKIVLFVYLEFVPTVFEKRY